MSGEYTEIDGGRSAVGLTRQIVALKIGSSNLLVHPIILYAWIAHIRLERESEKLEVAGSTPAPGTSTSWTKS